MTKEELAKKVDKIHEELLTLQMDLHSAIFNLSEKYYKNAEEVENDIEYDIYYDHSTDMDWLLGKSQLLDNKIDELRYVAVENYND